MIDNIESIEIRLLILLAGIIVIALYYWFVVRPRSRRRRYGSRPVKTPGIFSSKPNIPPVSDTEAHSDVQVVRRLNAQGEEMPLAQDNSPTDAADKPQGAAKSRPTQQASQTSYPTDDSANRQATPAGATLAGAAANTPVPQQGANQAPSIDEATHVPEMPHNTGGRDNSGLSPEALAKDKPNVNPNPSTEPPLQSPIEAMQSSHEADLDETASRSPSSLGEAAQTQSRQANTPMQQSQPKSEPDLQTPEQATGQTADGAMAGFQYQPSQNIQPSHTESDSTSQASQRDQRRQAPARRERQPSVVRRQQNQRSQQAKKKGLFSRATSLFAGKSAASGSTQRAKANHSGVDDLTTELGSDVAAEGKLTYNPAATLSERRSTKSTETEQEQVTQATQETEKTESILVGDADLPKKMVVISLYPQDESKVFKGAAIRSVMDTFSLVLSSKTGFFESMDMSQPRSESVSIFSVGHLRGSGRFERTKMMSMETTGLVFFMTIPGPVNAADAVDIMFSVAAKSAKVLNAKLCDQRKKKLTVDHMVNIRDEAVSFEKALIEQKLL